MKHSNISIFVPHEGCPQNCSFCNQRRISGTKKIPNEKDLEKAVETAFFYNKDLSSTELAFFGGSFTAISRDYMLRLLTKGKELVGKFNLYGIRISTRPDFIDEEILNLLKQYHVTSIELGAQSMDDEVLKLNDRGHTAQQIIDASKLILKNNFELGLQMMTGLYTSNSEKDMKTAEEIVALKPKTLRVYPTIVFKETKLCDLYEQGKYKPQSIENAVEICTKIIKLCSENKVKIIRLGLHSSDEVTNAVAGPIHPAIMELCQSKIFFEKLKPMLVEKGKYKIYVNKRQVSIATGQKKSNLNEFEKMGFEIKIVQNENVQFDDFIIEKI